MNLPSGFTSEVIMQWHPTKNSVALSNISQGSHDKVWWLCGKQHEWETQIRSRSGDQPTSCPVCAGKKLLSGFNDFTTTHPDLATQWHPLLNSSQAPDQIFSSSHQKAWWQCAENHHWQAAVRSRAEGAGCPVCSGKNLLSGFNDFATKHPQIMKEWDTAKNKNIDPSQIFSNNPTSVSWTCSQGHHWEAKIQNRANKNNGCPYCAKQKIDPETNSLAITHPKLASIWDAKRNSPLTMNSISVYSRQSCHWECSEGHQWQSPARTVATKNQPCMICKQQHSILPENLAAEWDKKLNQNQIASTTNPQRKVWWTSPACKHSWQAKIAHRLNGSGCIYCSGYKVLAGFNDLQTTNPELAQQWHPTKNNGLTPEQFTAGSKQRAWWICPNLHEWDTFIYARARAAHSSNCPTCSNSISQPETDLHQILTKLGFLVEKSNRKVLGNRMELDLYIPDKKLGIEFNGLYWHSENQGKGKNYHHDKYVAAKNASVQLLQVWEDDWNRRKPAILRALAHKLGVTDKLAYLYPELVAETTKVFARKTKIVLISTAEAKQFLEQNHIQGYASGSYYVGLKDTQGVLRALIVLKQEAGSTLNIVRYATAGSVTGGFTKLLTYATRTYHPDSYITFADHTISDGGLYENNGFVFDKEIRPDYMYVVNKQRKHKFGYRLKKFRTDPDLLWDENLSERELAILNNMPRIWDAGKTRYRLVLPPKH